MLRKLITLAVLATIAIAAPRQESHKPKAKAYKYTASYYNPCSGDKYKLYCAKGALKCTIDRYQIDSDTSYYITSYAIDHKECRDKKLFDNVKFARFCKVHFANDLTIETVIEEH